MIKEACISLKQLEVQHVMKCIYPQQCNGWTCLENLSIIISMNRKSKNHYREHVNHDGSMIPLNCIYPVTSTLIGQLERNFSYHMQCFTGIYNV